MDDLEVAASKMEAEFRPQPEKLSEEIMGGAPWAVRDAMLRLAAIGAEKDELAVVLTAIAERYRVKKERLEHEEQMYRSSIETFLLRFAKDGKQSFPDAGTAYLQTVKAKLTVEDPEPLAKWARKNGHVVEKVDTTAALKALLETGEAIKGVLLHPEHQAVRIRGAS